MVVIVVSFLITLTFLVSDIDGIAKLSVFGRLLRAVVLIRVIRAVYTEPKNLQRGIRHAVGENKRRLRVGEFDLDMTYICNNVIGMSFPSSGKMALYRNNIKDVAKYLDQEHGIGHYKVGLLFVEKFSATFAFILGLQFMLGTRLRHESLPRKLRTLLHRRP